CPTPKAMPVARADDPQPSDTPGKEGDYTGWDGAGTGLEPGGDWSGTGTGAADGAGSGQPVHLELLAQGGAVDALAGGGAAQVALAGHKTFAQQRYFNFPQHRREQVVGVAAIQIMQIAARSTGDVVAQRWVT